MNTKIVVIGARRVGKSSITLQFLEEKFLTDPDPKIDDSYQKTDKVDDESILFDILDPSLTVTSGGDSYSEIRDNYFRNASGFLLVYSITDRSSLDRIHIERELIFRVKDTDYTPIVLVGNKSDLEKDRQVSIEEGKELARKLEVPFFEVSSKTGKNVKELFHRIAREIKWHDSIELARRNEIPQLLLIGDKSDSIYDSFVHHENIKAQSGRYCIWDTSNYNGILLIGSIYSPGSSCYSRSKNRNVYITFSLINRSSLIMNDQMVPKTIKNQTSCKKIFLVGVRSGLRILFSLSEPVDKTDGAFSLLPNAILISIFSYLCKSTTWKLLSITCKRFCFLCKADADFKKIHGIQEPFFSTDEGISKAKQLGFDSYLETPIGRDISTNLQLVDSSKKWLSRSNFNSISDIKTKIESRKPRKKNWFFF